ncbi:MAG: DHHA1 domain-containing protein, partial [bacterium]|nr:DHHA1 domain-containing protein [bacterium]
MYQKEGTDNNAIVLYSNDWNIGIIGIVASKFVEKYYKPTFIMNYNSETQQFRCSARSVKGINLYEVLDTNSELFDGFGGHEMAAGFEFSVNFYIFNAVKTALNQTISEVLGDKILKPFVNIDLELDEKDLDLTLVDEISKLEPFGASNPSPIFAVKDFTLKEKTLMGENKNHLRLKVQGKDALYTCIWWSRGDISLVPEDKLDIAFSPKINTFRDVT